MVIALYRTESEPDQLEQHGMVGPACETRLIRANLLSATDGDIACREPGKARAISSKYADSQRGRSESPPTESLDDWPRTAAARTRSGRRDIRASNGYLCPGFRAVQA